jgi:hypothetical protein
MAYCTSDGTSMKYTYQINARPVEMGGGWRLRLLEDDNEAGGGVFRLGRSECRHGLVERMQRAGAQPLADDGCLCAAG